MLSKAQIKYIRSLTQQKYRNEHKVFIAEGEKIAGEWLTSKSRIQTVVATQDWVAVNTSLLSQHPEADLHIVKDFELAALSGLQTANNVLLVVHMPADSMPAVTGWSIALDGVQDPGNMGTIIRIADWFGISNIICSPDCADIYNPKVVQSGMGGHLRVQVREADLAAYLPTLDVPKIAATLDGQNIYNMAKPDAGVLIIGNESKGISAKVLAAATHRVTIPRKGGAESLNAAVSTGILCALLLQG